MSGNPDRPSSRHSQGGSHQPPAVRKHARGGSPKLVLCSCLFVSCLVWPALSASLPAIDDECEPKDCGVVHNVSYPFWIEERQPPQCGYPAFKLACKDDDAPRIRISGEDYAVARIFYTNQSFVVSSDNLSKSNCPVPSHNLLLDATPFSLNALDRNLSFFSVCPEGEPGHRIECPAGGDGDQYIVVGNQSSSDREEAAKRCRTSVSWPYLGDGSAEGDENYSVLVKRGFLLTWSTVVNCSMCRASGGGCRYDLLREAFSCACSDRSHAISCNSSGPIISQNRGGTSKRNIAIGVGAGVGGFLLACVLCFLVYRRKRMRARTGSSTLLFRTTSSEPPSGKDPEVGGSTHHYPTHLFKYEELSEATDGFSEANELGDGGFGTVYKGKLRDGRIVAVKRLYENNYKRVEQFMNEVAILNRLQHPNLVTLYGCTSRHSRELLLVYEYVPNGTVADHLHGDRAAAPEGSTTTASPVIGWPVRLGIAVETATALAYLHKVEPQIIHRDVKTNNILLDDNFHVKVADFGLSRLFPVDATHVSTAPQGTPGYVDPEYHQCYQLTDKSDVYSFGVVLAELISSKPAVDITRHRHEINLANMAVSKIQNGALHELVDPALGFDTDWAARRTIKLVAELAFRCLQTEKEMRPSMEDVAQVLRGIRECQLEEEEEEAAAARRRRGDGDPAVGDDTSLLKKNGNAAPFSPDSVMDKWASRTTTPNTSA